MIGYTILRLIDLVGVAIIAHIIFSFVKPHHDIALLLYNALQPLLRPVRDFLNRYIPALARFKFDFTAIVILIGLILIRRILLLIF